MRALVLVLLVVLGLAVAAFERWSPERMRPLREPIAQALAAYLRPIRIASDSAGEWTDRTGRLWRVEDRNTELRRRLMETELELQATRQHLRRLERISGLRRWKMPEELTVIAADVIGYSTEDEGAEWIINRGELDGLELGLPVVGLGGLAGVIREVASRSARVQALTDPLSAVGVVDSETRDRGIVLGDGRGRPLAFFPENEIQPIRMGALLETSGFSNSVYPKGLVVGRITGRRFDERGVELGLVVPAVHFAALEDVLVIRRVSSPAPGAERGLGTFALEMPTTSSLGPALLDLEAQPEDDSRKDFTVEP